MTLSGSDQAMDKILARSMLTVPVMLVHSLWDQEDIYGGHGGLQGDQTERHRGTKYFWSWDPGTMARRSADGSSLGATEIQQRYGASFPPQILRPFLDQYLKDEPPDADDSAGHCVRNRHEPMAAAACLAVRLRQRLQPQRRGRSICMRTQLSFTHPQLRRRHSTNTSLILPIRCRTCRGPTTTTCQGADLERAGWSDDQRRRPAARTW